MTDASRAAGPRIVACVKWVDTRPEVDSLTGHVHTDPRTHGASDADRAALEVVLQLAERWGGHVEVVTAGPAGAEVMLRDLGATGATCLVRVDVDPAAPSDRIAMALSEVVRGADVVVCGDHSLDRGSGSVPAFVAHHLDAEQASGVTALEPADVGALRAVRRLGYGRSEVVVLRAPAVVAVEGAVATLRRASLAAVLAAESAPVEVVSVASAFEMTSNVAVEQLGPWHPPTRVVPPPVGDDARDRILTLTGALVDHTPPRTVELAPAEAAEAIVEQLRTWGYLE